MREWYTDQDTNGNRIIGLPAPSISSEAATKDYVDNFIASIAIGFIIDGGGSVILTGVKGDIEVPFDCTILGVDLLADQIGDVVVDIWADSYANFPPTIADTITGTALPTITSDIKSSDSTLSGWTTTILSGTILRYNVNSCTNIQRLSISLKVLKN